MSPRDNHKPLTVRHAAAVAAVGIIGIIVAFWILSSIVGIVFFFVKLAVVVALVAGVIWLLSRFRR